MKKLSEFLTKNAMSQARFAAIIGKHPSIITRILSGESKPDLETLEAIEHGSGGQVTAQDFYKKKPVNGSRKRAN
jgi:transcriptional regulator with XRE-family HTH domain